MNVKTEGLLNSGPPVLNNCKDTIFPRGGSLSPCFDRLCKDISSSTNMVSTHTLILLDGYMNVKTEGLLNSAPLVLNNFQDTNFPRGGSHSPCFDRLCKDISSSTNMVFTHTLILLDGYINVKTEGLLNSAPLVLNNFQDTNFPRGGSLLPMFW